MLSECNIVRLSLSSAQWLDVGRQVAQKVKSELLSDPAASLFEELLVERVGAGRLQTVCADAAAAQARKPLDLAQLEQLQRRQERAQKGYMVAICTLATLRKLLATADIRTAVRRESSRRSVRANS
jgi:hypothetical protein